MAIRATIRSSRRLTLRPISGRPITAFLVTSAPVPAVVGRAMKGKGSAFQGQTFSHHLQMLHRPAGRRDQRRQSLGKVEYRPSSQADHDLRFEAACLLQGRFQHRQRRLAAAGQGLNLGIRYP